MIAVGYNSTAMRSGNTAFAPQFAGIGSADGSFDLQQLKCNEAADWSVMFCELAANGFAGETYTWTADDGWLDEEFSPVEGKTITPGMALWVAAENSDQAVISAGEVSKSDFEVTLRSGSTLCGNPHPVAVDLQDITCNAASDWGVMFCELAANGFAGETYTWTNDDGWLDEEFAPVVGKTITAGMGLWVSADSSDQSIIFNAPDYE